MKTIHSESIRTAHGSSGTLDVLSRLEGETKTVGGLTKVFDVTLAILYFFSPYILIIAVFIGCLIGLASF
jgi:hypothetical protein